VLSVADEDNCNVDALKPIALAAMARNYRDKAALGHFAPRKRRFKKGKQPGLQARHS